MTQLNELKLINDSTIVYLKKLNKNYQRNEIIKHILDDASCFFKMNKNDAYTVLEDIGIANDQIDTIYQNLISHDEFYNLLQCEKINLNDKELIIKYPIYEKDNLFKNKNINNHNNESNQNTFSIIPYKKESFIKKILKKLFS